MSAVSYASTKTGHHAIWLGAPIPTDPFRAADYFLDTAGAVSYAAHVAIFAAMRVIAGGTVEAFDLPSQYAAAAWRVRSGHPAWPSSARPPAFRKLGYVDDGKRASRMLDLLTGAEIASIAAIEATSARLAGEVIQGWRGRGRPAESVFTKSEIDRLYRIETEIGRIKDAAFDRKHPRAEFSFDWRAIALGNDKAAAFAVLGIPATADQATIRTAWRRKALATHPDRGGSAEAFRVAKAAYDAVRGA